MLMHPCPRCGKLTPKGQPYCPECLPRAEADREAYRLEKERRRDQAYNARRDPKYQKFYATKDWKVLSRARLSEAGYKCQAKLEGCTGLACEVHHIHPLRTPEGWDQRLDWDNLMAVCISCHNQLDGKTFKRKAPPAGVVDIQEVETKLREADPPGAGQKV